MKRTKGGGHEGADGVQEAGAGGAGEGGGGAVAEAWRVAPERGRELGRGLREGVAEAVGGAAGAGVPEGGGVGVGGGGVRPRDAADAPDGEPVGPGGVVLLGARGDAVGGRGGEGNVSEVRGQKEEVASASRARAPAREGGAADGAEGAAFTKAYAEAVYGLLAVIRFGSMMLVKDMSLTRETRQGCLQTGETLKGWLAAHAPDVNYKTAMRMKGTAEAVCAGLGCEASALLRCLTPDPTSLPGEPDGEALIDLRERLLEIIHGRSERSLVLWLKGGAPAPLPPGGEEDTGGAEAAALDAARRFARTAADALKCLDPRKRATVARDVAKAFREALGLKGLAWLAKVLAEAEGE